MLKGYIDAYWVKNSNMKKSPNQNGKKFRGRWGNCWNMKKFPNCGWMCREGLGEYLEWQKNTQCRRKCYRNAVPFALRCASCSCRAGALYIQSENQPIVSKLPWLISSCLCTACRNAQIPVYKIKKIEFKIENNQFEWRRKHLSGTIKDNWNHKGSQKVTSNFKFMESHRYD